MRAAPWLVSTLLIMCCWAAPAAAVPAFPENCKLVRLAALPMTIEHRHITVDVKLDGQPFRFMVDTGGVFSAISPAAAKQVGHTTHLIRNNLRIQDAGGGEATRYARIDTVGLGTARLENLTLMEAALPDGEDGVIAPEILRGFDVDFDFDQHLLTLFKPHRCDDHVVYWTDDFAAIPFSVTEQGHIRIDVELDGKKLHALLDTGSPYTMIGPETLKSMFPEKDAADPSFGLKGGNGGVLSASPVTFDNFAFGKFIWRKPILFAASADQAWKSDGADILLGLRELYGLHLYIDYRDKILYVSRRLPGGAAPN